MDITMIDAPPCSGIFRATCSSCGRPCHPRSSTRICADGHDAYRGIGRCNRCYMRSYHAKQFPTVSLVRRANHKRRPRTGKPAHLRREKRLSAPPARGLISSPCGRCGNIAPLPYGPGEALCGACLGAEILDRALGP